MNSLQLFYLDFFSMWLNLMCLFWMYYIPAKVSLLVMLCLPTFTFCPLTFRNSSGGILLFYFAFHPHTMCEWDVIVCLLSEWIEIVHFTLILINMIPDVLCILVLFAGNVLNKWVFDMVEKQEVWLKCFLNEQQLFECGEYLKCLDRASRLCYDVVGNHNQHF